MKQITNNFFIVSAELKNNLWCRIPIQDVQRAIQREQNLFLVDVHSNFASSSYSLFEIDKYRELDEKEYPYIYLEFQKEEDYILPTIFCKLLYKIHHNWINELFEYFLSEDFNKLLKQVNESTIPDYTNRWNFLISDPYKLKAAIISEIAYPNQHHIGICLGTFEKQAPATLLAIENTLKNSKPFGWSFQTSCVDLMVQNCLLLNKDIALGIHNETFFNKLIETLNKQHLRAVLLLGSGLYPLEQSIDCGAIIKEEHPLPVLKSKREYKTDVFLKFEQLTNIQF